MERLSRIEPEFVILAVQVLGELFNVLVRKAGRPRAEARSAIMSWRDAFAVGDTTPAVVLPPLPTLPRQHGDRHLGAVIISLSQSRAGCRLLLTEDFMPALSGTAWRSSIRSYGRAASFRWRRSASTSRHGEVRHNATPLPNGSHWP